MTENIKKELEGTELQDNELENVAGGAPLLPNSDNKQTSLMLRNKKEKNEATVKKVPGIY